jgi:hypothetical protein
MIVKTETPDPRGNRGGRKATIYPSGNIKLEYTENHPNLQAIRAAFLARRHRLAPGFAAAVAGLAFTVEAPR